MGLKIVRGFFGRSVKGRLPILAEPACDRAAEGCVAARGPVRLGPCPRTAVLVVVLSLPFDVGVDERAMWVVRRDERVKTSSCAGDLMRFEAFRTHVVVTLSGFTCRDRFF